uniref:Uncharacterized protein n=1 Tax=Opuntia streptacantha TaxID=393608 RepID=A0A7C9DLT6_OPUST
MAGKAYEEAIAGLNKLLSEKGELNEVAAEKIKLVTAELQATKAGFDPIERIKSGFLRFKTEKYEYVTFLLSVFLFVFWYHMCGVCCSLLRPSEGRTPTHNFFLFILDN